MVAPRDTTNKRPAAALLAAAVFVAFTAVLAAVLQPATPSADASVPRATAASSR